MQKQFAIENIEKSRLKVATLESMNDPYEFYPRMEGASNEEIERFKVHYSEIAGFLCFSRRLGDPLQWAHYADNHRGICFEFHVPDKYLKKITYIKKPTVVSAANRDWKEALVRGTLCKYRSWKYEREYRIAVDLTSNDLVKENGLFFSPFSPECVPVKVYLGLRCNLDGREERIISDSGLPLVKMSQDVNSYSIVHA